MDKLNPKIELHTLDEWMRLAREDPEQFERDRKRAIDEAIAREPKDRQLHWKQMQFRIDALRRKYHNPLMCTEMLYLKVWRSHSQMFEVMRNGVSKEPNAPKAPVIAISPKT